MQFFRNSSCRILFGALSLATLVLSNAYKNDNVYSKVAPRRAISYQNLDQLIQENFTLYLRSRKPIIDFNHLILPLKWKLTSQASYSEDLNVVVASEISTLWSSFHRGFEKVIFKMAKLHKKAQSELQTLIPQAHKNYEFLGTDDVEFQVAYAAITSNAFLKMEENILLEELKNCNKSAIILPQEASLQYAVKLNNQNQTFHTVGKIHIGKEKYFKQYFSFNLRGHISLYMLKRVKGIQVSGIMNWWEHLIMEGFEREHY